MTVNVKPTQRVGTSLGSIADTALSTLDGGTLRLADLRGKWVLLFCWASW